MTIDELKANLPEFMRLRSLCLSPDWAEVSDEQMMMVNDITCVFLDLAPEILALVEAASSSAAAPKGLAYWVGDILAAKDAFNAKLESL